MKILVYKDNLSSGRGADRAVCNLVNALALRGHRLTVVTCQPAGVPFSCDFDTSVKITRVSHPHPHGLLKVLVKFGLSDIETKFGSELADAVDAEKPDVIISTGTNELIDLTRVRALNSPIVQQLHIYPSALFKRKRFHRNALIRAAFAKVAAVQVLLPSHITALRKILGSALPTSTPITVIGNTSTLTASTKKDITSEPIILYPAALTFKKRQDLLIEAFARIADRYPGWSIQLYGIGGKIYTHKLTRLIAKLHLEKRIVFKGWCNDLTKAYESCSFVALPSAVEGFGLVIIDAAVFGKPTIGCINTPSVNELIRDNETGLLSKDEPEAFADALSKLMDDSEYCAHLGSNARNAYDASYAPNEILRQWLVFLSSVKAMSTSSPNQVR